MAFGQVDGTASPTALTLDTKTTLGTDPQTVNGTYQLMLNMTNAAAGDVFLIRSYEKLTGTGDAQLVTLLASVAGVQESKRWFSVPELWIFGGKYEIEQTGGTGRVIGFSVRRIDAT